VELGGDLRIQGTTNDVQPVGQFDLRRGRLLILGQRIEFDEGSLQLVGNLDPLIHFVARTQSEDVTAIVTVDGRVSSPQISFSSQPPLPEDEVLARVLFNRATQDLSAFQVAQLAAAAAELAGGGGPGLLSQIRGATGLDDLDVITQEDGSTAVRAGKYIDENIYLDVQTDTDGVSRAEINLDVTDNLTARGSVGTDGNTTFGLFFERDY
jgi:translocation and assembly module TamB